VTEQGRAPQNQFVNSSPRFVVWNAFADDLGEHWTIRSYDVMENKAVAIYSYKDAVDLGTTTWTSFIVPEKDLLLVDIWEAAPTDMSGHRLVFADLVQGKVVRVLDDPATNGFPVARRWSKMHAIDDCIYMERQRSGTWSTAAIVRLNLTTWKEEAVISASPFHIMTSSPDGSLALVPYQEDYPGKARKLAGYETFLIVKPVDLPQTQ